MSITLGWLAVLAGFAGAPVPRVDGPEITYQFQIVEMRGLEWRGGTVPGLKPVTSRGGVTVWTAPRGFLDSLPESAGKQVLMAPRVTAYSQAVAHITSRNVRPFVTQVAWRGGAAAPRETTENVREGMTVTVSGRSIDQGVLAQVVIEDTEVRSVHTLSLPNPAKQASHAMPAEEVIQIGACTLPVKLFEADPCSKSEMPNSSEAFSPATCHGATADAALTKIAKFFGAKDACCAETTDADGSHGKPAQACSSSCTAEKSAQASACTAQVQVPEIGHAEISGEWLVPRDEVLLIGFGPHTVADKDGKAVIRERLAMLTAEEVAMPVPTAGSEPVGVPLPAPMSRVARSAAPTPAPSSLPLPTPPIPPRSMPQGIHADGTVADLPPLPADEKADQDASDSSDARPSPQSKKPARSAAPEPKPAPKPSKSPDGKISKASFTLPMGLFKQATLPQLSFPNLQFMMPLRPFAMKLPFNQKLELELIGRVVADSDGPDDSSDAE